MKLADNKSRIFGFDTWSNIFSASTISYTYLFKIMIMELENNEIESIAANIPKLQGNKPNLPTSAYDRNIKYELANGLADNMLIAIKL